jgi:ribosomal protein S18 acetylase RimI-like enzyme
MASRTLLSRLAAQFAAAVADGSEVHATEGFRVHLWREADPFYRNVAIPAGPAGDRRRAIAAMAAVFEAHGRIPRLEFFAELWPGLAEALEEEGFVLERRAGVLTLDTAPEPAPAAAPRLLDATTPPEELEIFLAQAAAAFGEPALAPAPGELDRFARGLRQGSIAAATVPAPDGTPLSGASLIRSGPVAELAGVWTMPAWRRRGLARAICALLLARFFGTGGEVAWLSAGDAASEALYRSLGFVLCGTQLNYARLPAAPTRAAEPALLLQGPGA